MFTSSKILIYYFEHPEKSFLFSITVLPKFLTFSASFVSSNSLFCRLAGTGLALCQASVHMFPGICILVLRWPKLRYRIFDIMKILQ